MKTYEASAKTEQEAIEIGLKALGVSISDVEVTVLEEGSKGLFGLFGSRPTKVRLVVKDEAEDPLDELVGEKRHQNATAENVADKPVKRQNTEKSSAPMTEKKPEPVRRTAKPEKQERAAETDTIDSQESFHEPVKALEKPEVTMIPDDQLDAASPAGEAKAFLSELTKLMGVEVEIAMGTDAEGTVYGKMSGDTLGILIGRRGETLDAIQYLTSLKVNRGKEGYTRISLDTENYRAKREETLIRLANRYANRAVKTGRRVSLEPMNPYERRIIHSALQQNDLVDTHSEGDEPNRHVVITLKK